MKRTACFLLTLALLLGGFVTGEAEKGVTLVKLHFSNAIENEEIYYKPDSIEKSYYSDIGLVQDTRVVSTLNTDGFTNGVKWKKLSGTDAGSDVFAVSGCYRVTVALEPVSGYKFSSPFTVYINGTEATVEWRESTYAIVSAEINVKTRSVTKELDLRNTLKLPQAGEKTYDRISLSYTVFNDPEILEWRDETANYSLPLTGSEFLLGHVYSALVRIKLNKGWYLLGTADKPQFKVLTNETVTDTDVRIAPSDCTVNGIKSVTVKVVFAKIPDLSSIVITGITEPAPKNNPTYHAEVANDAYYTVTGQIIWESLSSKEELDPTDTFEMLASYRVTVFLKPKPGYQFPSIQSLRATVNGIAASKIEKIGEIFVVSADFICAGKISSVSVTGVTPPLEGAKPSFYATVASDADYTVENYTSGDWRNGVFWEDLTAGGSLTATDTFIAGHTYRVEISLLAKYEEAFPFSYDGITATVNGQETDMIRIYRNANIGVRFDFVCAEKEKSKITSITVFFEQPEAGKEPDWNMVMDTDRGYELEDVGYLPWYGGVSWRDDSAGLEGLDMYEGNWFEGGHTYTVIASLIAKEGYEFTDKDTLKIIFGKEAPDEVIDWGFPKRNIGLVRHYTLPEKPRLPGDANEDGRVDMKDALLVLQDIQLGFIQINTSNANVNGDEYLDMADALLIAQYAAGWSVALK